MIRKVFNISLTCELFCVVKGRSSCVTKPKWQLATITNFYIPLRKCSKKVPDKTLMVFNDFNNATEKSKNTFLEMIRLYETRHKQRRGHVEFVYSALKHMEEFGVEKDIQIYKALIDVMPKGKMIPTNLFQVEFMHYPKQQQCIIDLLEKMEDNGVIPDAEMEPMLLNVFGNKGYPLRKYWRMMYWMPKFKNLSPWKVPNPPPNNALELAKIAIERITSVDLKTSIETFECDEVDDSIDKTWIVSGISPVQVDLLNRHPNDRPVILEAGGQVWLRSRSVKYFVLKSEPVPGHKRHYEDFDDVSNIENPYFNITGSKNRKELVSRTAHEQDDGIIYGVCATGTSSKDSALSWVRLLQKHKSPILEKVAILFRFRQPTGELIPFVEDIAPSGKNVAK